MHVHCGKDIALIRHSAGSTTPNCLLITAFILTAFSTQNSSSCVSRPVYSSDTICYHSLSPGSLCTSDRDLLVASTVCHMCSLFGWAVLLAWGDSPFFCLSSGVTALSLRLCSGHPLLPPALCLLVFFVCCSHCQCVGLPVHWDHKLLEGHGCFSIRAQHRKTPVTRNAQPQGPISCRTNVWPFHSQVLLIKLRNG